MLFGPRPETRGERIAQSVEDFRAVWGDDPFDEDDITSVVGEMHDRAWRPEAFPLHGAAALRTPSRVEALRRLRVRALILQGSSDPLSPPDRAEAVADLIPGAKLVLIEGWGHSLPRARWDELVKEILQHTAAAEH